MTDLIKTPCVIMDDWGTEREGKGSYVYMYTMIKKAVYYRRNRMDELRVMMKTPT